MCLAIPGKVIAVDKEAKRAMIDYEAEQREVGTALLPDVKIGDYVLVQAKMVVQQIPEKEARKALEAIRDS
ncbi:MAG: HypC/HybG/HupF family hydrogenase formation chaperone [Tenericutes bacterium]|nr:MAG: HypC/HybG/HupF family hydrogenase formation chaperone [Mycoplasmatota bacterium]